MPVEGRQHGRLIEKRHVRLAHDPEIDREERDHRQDRGEKVEDAEADIERRGDDAGGGARQHGGACRKPGIEPGDDEHGGDRRAKREGAVHREIGKVEYPEGEIDPDRHEGEDEAEFDGTPEGYMAHFGSFPWFPRRR